MAPTMTLPLDPQQLLRMRAAAALFGAQPNAQPAIADETPTAPPAPTLSATPPILDPKTAPTWNAPGGLSTAVNMPGRNPTPGGPPAAVPIPNAPAVDRATPVQATAPMSSGGATPAQPLSEADWDKQHPQAVAEAYKAPDWKMRALRALSGGALGWRSPEAAAQQNARFSAEDEAEKQRSDQTAQQADVAQHSGYQRYIEGQEAPLRLQQLREQISDAQAQEADRRADAAKKNAAANAPTTQKLTRAIIDDPQNPGSPINADFDPKTGKYLDPDTGEPIKGAKPWERPQTQTAEDKAIADYLDEHKLENTAANRNKARTHIQQKPEEGTWSFAGEDKDGNPIEMNSKSGAMRQAPAGVYAKGSHARTAAEQDKQIRPLEQGLNEVQMAHTLKDEGDKGNAEADVGLALTFFKVMRGAQGGSNIRFTQQENNLIMGARGLQDAMEVKGNKVFSHGQPLGTQQRAQMMEVIDSYGTAAQRMIDQIKQPAQGAPAASKDPAGLY